MAMNPVRLRLTVQRDQAYHWIGNDENATGQGFLIFFLPQILRQSPFLFQL